MSLHILLNSTLFLKPTIWHELTSGAEKSDGKHILTFQLQFDEISVPQILKKHPIRGWCFEIERDVCAGFPLESGEVKVGWWSNKRSCVPVIPCMGQTGNIYVSVLPKGVWKVEVLMSVYVTVLFTLKKTQTPWFYDFLFVFLDTACQVSEGRAS